jgi:hypothetical protein
MEVVVERFGFGQDSTLGEIQVDGIHECWSLEDERRETKVWGETCISAGTYSVFLRTDGDRHERYRTRFPDVHAGVLQLEDVPGFVAIQIHPGNDDDDTAGCILPGSHPLILPDGEFKVAASTPAYLALYKKMVQALYDGEDVTVTVRERKPLP